MCQKCNSSSPHTHLFSHLCHFPCHNTMLPLPRNALERSSARTLGLITGYFPWIQSSGIIRQDSAEIVLSNSRFIDMVRAERFMIKWRKCLEFVSNKFDSSMKRFWVHVSSSLFFVVVVVFSSACILTKYQDIYQYHSLALAWRTCSTWSLCRRCT